MIVCLLAPPAGGEHGVMHTRNEAVVVWVTSNVIWHYNPWLCTVDPVCRWPDDFHHPTRRKGGQRYLIQPSEPNWDPAFWTKVDAAGSRRIRLLEQPYKFDDPPGDLWAYNDVAVTACEEWQGLEARNCGHKSPGGFHFYGGHRTADPTDAPTRGIHGNDPAGHVPPARENSADRHEVFGVCVKPEDEPEFAGKTGDALIAAWIAYHDRAAHLIGKPTRNTHNEMKGWSADALQSFSYVSNTPGEIVLWQETMDRNQVMSVTDFHGTDNAALEIDPATDEVDHSNGLVDTCLWHLDDGGPCDPSLYKLNTTDGIINDNPNPVLDRCKDSCYHGAWANYDALDHLPDTNTARQAAYEADHSIVPHPWIHPWGRPGQGGWAPGANPNAVRQFEPPPDKYWVLQPPDWDYTLDVPAGEWEWAAHPDDPGDHPDSPWPVCVFMSAI